MENDVELGLGVERKEWTGTREWKIMNTGVTIQLQSLVVQSCAGQAGK